ncbi:MAG: hypothetical protein M1469_07395 [Bacteroidetes bacterium]|nr:hypothetical protein [Bacteroidota bacterium]
MKTRFLFLSVLGLFVSFSAYAQTPEDALRLAESGYGISARSVAMGNAMTGLAQGYDATTFNPAGLAQSRQSEVSFGLNFLGYNNDASYLGNQGSLSSSQTDVSNIGLVYPFPTTRGGFVIAFGFNRGPDFNSALSVSGFNPNSSIIPSLYYPGDTLADIPYMVFLEDVNQNPLVAKDVNQSGKIYTSGGINNWLASAGMDIAQNFSIGLTINLINGTYKYTRAFSETGIQGYTYNNSDFGSFLLNSQDNQDINGWNAKVGFLYRWQDMSGATYARFGATIAFPSFLTISDNYASQGSAYFTTAPVGPYNYSTSNGYGQDEGAGPAVQYDVATPFKFSLGASGETSQLTVAADLQYVDWTQLNFSNSNLGASTINDLNSQIKQEYKPTLNTRIGVELALTDPQYSLFVPYIRAGGELLPSPYSGDGSSQAQKYVSGGVGARIQNAINIDFAYQYGWWQTNTLVYPSTVINNTTYPGQSTSNEKISNTNFIFTFAYNF